MKKLCKIVSPSMVKLNYHRRTFIMGGRKRELIKKRQKKFASDLKSIYLSGSEQQAMQNLDGVYSLEKALFLSVEKISKKWTYPIRNWGSIFRELSVMFEECINY
ncbi:hypothetical protein O0R46_03660 [Peptostreptococcus equinus]|uniref:Transposase n=1 Tax=Peptostreptococcus equinus TaxID=3003601 RepID=A0ABY7JQB7_9FIRM|nr:hypothetical protein [Peptostreptococcus sp. CBA3647]WAW15551.1 hypothetical protein O0R46_03660 [Peptostreptococcus sp. CBA3647]